MLSKETSVLHEYKPLWSFSRLNDFTTDTVANLFALERLKIPEAYSESSQTSTMELFGKMTNR